MGTSEETGFVKPSWERRAGFALTSSELCQTSRSLGEAKSNSLTLPQKINFDLKSCPLDTIQFIISHVFAGWLTPFYDLRSFS